MTVHGMYKMETIITVMQADYVLQKLGSTRNYLTRHCKQPAASKINLNFLKKTTIYTYKILQQLTKKYTKYY